MKWRTSPIRRLLYCTWRFTGVNLCRKYSKYITVISIL